MSILSQQKQSVNTDFPNLRPSLDLRFALAKKLDPRVTFSRGSTGTYFGPDGLMRTAIANEPRFDHDPITGQSLGLLIEESRTNLFTSSNDFSASGGNSSVLWNGSISANVITSPDGTTNASKFISNTLPTTSHYPQKTVSSVAGNNYTFSVFVKAAEVTTIVLVCGNGSWYRAATFNLITGVATSNSQDVGVTAATTYTITPYPNGWYRCSVTSGSSDGTNCFTQIRASTGTKTNAIFGDGTSGFYVYGEQIETGAFPTSYIPTVASTVTRSVDLASMEGTNFSSWYNSSEGTLYAAARVNALGGSVYPGIAYVDDGTTNNSIGFYVNDAGNDTIGAEAYTSGRAQYSLLSSSATIANKLNKVISSYSINNFSAAFDTSSRVQRDISGSIPTVNRLVIGSLRGGFYPLNGTISRLTYYPIQITNQQLINLVS